MLPSLLVAFTLQASPPGVCFLPKEPCLQQLLTSVRAATDSIDVVVYKFKNDDVAEALSKASRQGRRVRVLLDADEVEKDIVRKLGEKVHLRVLKASDDLHHKFMVIDGKLLIAGSVNYNKNLVCCNEENMLFLDNGGLLSRFGEKFEALFARGEMLMSGVKAK